MSVVVFVAAGGALYAQPLTLDTVLHSAQTQYPRIIEQLANQQSALQAADIAQGAFDPRIESDSYARASGFWNGRAIDTQLSKRLGVANARVYGGYRRSRGDFPIYEDELFTNRGGEAKVGIEFSLLRDRRVDPERVALVTAELTANDAKLGLFNTRLEIQRLATRRYQSWLAAGFKMLVYRDLLAIARQREGALQRRVDYGDAAPILLTENRRNLLRRQSLVVDAEQQFDYAGQALSLFLRDAKTGAPQTPAETALPPEWTVPDAISGADINTLVTQAIARHPELQQFDNRIAAQQQKIGLEKNRLAPKLDMRAELSSDFGGGSETRDGVDTIVALRFELPLGLRAQRGALRAAEADLAALQQQQRLLADRIGVAIRQLLLQLDAFHQAILLAADAEQQNELLEKAERKLFEQGASDFFLLNLREENTADARIQRISAKQKFLLARADYEAALVVPAAGKLAQF